MCVLSLNFIKTHILFYLFFFQLLGYFDNFAEILRIDS